MKRIQKNILFFVGMVWLGGAAMGFEIKSAAFKANDVIPKKYACDGENISPPLEWNDPPAGTNSFALVVDDPDAPMGTWVHWVTYNIPQDIRELPEGFPQSETFPDGTKQGFNGSRQVGYEGPCPPPGPYHRYHFKLCALDGALDLPPGTTQTKLLDAMKGHLLAETELVGRYKR